MLKIMTINLFCANCSYGEDADKAEFTISQGSLVCKDCFLAANKGKF